ncbi:MAG TPA: YbaN family protein [Gemmata sp.]
MNAPLSLEVTISGPATPKPPEANVPVTHAPRQATGLRRFLYVCAGLVCVGLAYLGVLLPGLPTTPWVLLASFLFSRSSLRLNRWLKRSPLFGKLLRDWDEHGGIRRPVKVLAVCLVVTVVSLSLAFRTLPLWLKCVIAGLALVGICTIVFVVPTVREGSEREERDAGGERPPPG